MNNLLLLVSLLLMLSVKAQAQLTLIPRAGLTFSTVAFANNVWEDRKTVAGFTAAVGINYSLTADNFLSIQPELVYTQKGFAAKGRFITVNYNGTYRLNYIELPVLLKLSFGTETIHAYVNAGPSAGYLLNGKVKGNANQSGTTVNLDKSIIITETPNPLDVTELDANRIEVSANAGIGVGYLIGEKANLFLDIRYTMGVTDFDQTQESKNRVISLSAGLQIPF